jgi:mannan endo-1,4-beta-mannosidase
VGVDAYAVYRTQVGGMPVIAIVRQDIAGAYPRMVFTALTPSTRYEVRVAAMDAAGNTSAYSASLTVTTPAVAGGCRVSYTVVAQWSGGYQVAVTISCDPTAPVVGWQLWWAMPAGHTVVQAWNAGFATAGTGVTATNQPWNATIEAGGSVSFGFTVAATGAPGIPTAFTLNGVPCQVG